MPFYIRSPHLSFRAFSTRCETPYSNTAKYSESSTCCSVLESSTQPPNVRKCILTVVIKWQIDNASKERFPWRSCCCSHWRFSRWISKFWCGGISITFCERLRTGSAIDKRLFHRWREPDQWIHSGVIKQITKGVKYNRQIREQKTSVQLPILIPL